MTIYLDASFVVAVLAEERHSAAARTFVAEQDVRSLVVSPWVETEVASALAMKERRGDIDAGERGRLLLEWEKLRLLVTTAPIADGDFASSARLVDAGPHGLRAGDALHLAIAERHRCGMATFDRDLADAARAIGLVAPVIIAEA